MMENEGTEVLFPPRIIPQLRSLRGKEWQELVDRVCELEAESLDRLAFVLLMVRLDGCTTCEADSFRAMRGCLQCASQAVKRFRGSDQDLLEAFQDAREEVQRYIRKTNRLVEKL